MKKLALILSLAAFSLGMSSCCSMFGLGSQSAGYTTETKQVKTCSYDIVTKEVYTPGSAKGGKGGMTQTIEEKVPRYKTVTKKKRVSCGPCVRFFCPRKDCCGTTSESLMKMATTQSATGSPHMGMVPTMKPLAP